MTEISKMTKKFKIARIVNKYLFLSTSFVIKLPLSSTPYWYSLDLSLRVIDFFVKLVILFQ